MGFRSCLHKRKSQISLTIN